MMKMMVIGIGGLMGSIARYIFLYLSKYFFNSTFPLSTLAVNSIGCLCLGFLMEISNKWIPREGLIFSMISVGFIGGLTTFSAFSFETLELIKNNQLLTAGVNFSLNLVLGFGGIIAGHYLARFINS